MQGKGLGRALVARQPTDLLDQVDLALEVGTERRDTDRPDAAGLVDLALEPAQEGRLLVGRYRVAQQRVGPGRPVAQPATLGRPGAPDVDHARSHGASAQLGEQPAGEVEASRHEVRVESLLEPVARLAADAGVHLGTQDAGAAEVGRLEDDVGRMLVHLGVDGAEHTGDDEWLLDVGDDQHLVVEPALDPVQGDDLLPRLRPAGDQRTAGDLGRVERVQRLAPGKHHVVRHVDDVVDGPHAGVREARLEPRRRVPGPHAADHAHRVSRAEVGGRHLHGDGSFGGGAAQHRRTGGGRRRQLRSRGRGYLPGDAVDAEAVGPVRRQLELEHSFTDRQVVAQRTADLPVGRQHDDPRALGLVAELLLAQHHPVALDAAQVGLLQLEAALEDGAAQ